MATSSRYESATTFFWFSTYLLQALWGNFLKNGVGEYISIQVCRICTFQFDDDFQAQDFDVPSTVLSHLVQAGIVKIHPRWVIIIPAITLLKYSVFSDSDKVRMEDFTCAD